MHLRIQLIALLLIGIVSLSFQRDFELCGYKRNCVPNDLCTTTTNARGGATLFDLRVGESSCPEFQICCYAEDIVDNQTDLVPQCGQRNIDGIGSKVELMNKDDTQFGEFPWMLSISHRKVEGRRAKKLYKCGGSLITDKVVLTCAHCVFEINASQIVVRAGEWEPNAKTELLPHEDRSVGEMVVHEEFNSATLYNDVALLFLSEPFILSPHIQTICLPPADFSFANSSCLSTGWGRYNFSEGGYPKVLKKLDLPMVPRDKCEAILRTTVLTDVFDLHESFLCAGGEPGKDMCTADGGSPLVCSIPGSSGRYYQVGLVAWGIGCGENQIPGVYASVPFLRGWIDRQLASRDVETPYLISNDFK